MGNYLVPSGRGGYMIRKNSGAMVINESELDRMINEKIGERLKNILYSKNGFRKPDLDIFDKRNLENGYKKTREEYYNNLKNRKNYVLQRSSDVYNYVANLIHIADICGLKDLVKECEKYEDEAHEITTFANSNDEDGLKNVNSVINDLEKLCIKINDFFNENYDYYTNNPNNIRKMKRYLSLSGYYGKSIDQLIKNFQKYYDEIIDFTQMCINDTLYR